MLLASYQDRLTYRASTLLRQVLARTALLCLTIFASGCAPDDAASGLRAFQEKDYATATAIWRKLAQENDSTAQLYLGRMYELGEGVRSDMSKAALWYLKAAERGNPYAQGNLAVLYAYGRGVEADFVRSYAWSTNAANGYPKWAEDLRAAALTNRDIVGAKMSAPELIAAQKLAESLQTAISNRR